MIKYQTKLYNRNEAFRKMQSEQRLELDDGLVLRVIRFYKGLQYSVRGSDAIKNINQGVANR